MANASADPAINLPCPDDPLMAGAWSACLSWALGNPDALASFRAATGNRWSPGRPGLEAMIDRATGADKAFLEAFVGWFNENVWGPLDGTDDDEPSSLRGGPEQ